jgi:hypothetical protein
MLKKLIFESEFDLLKVSTNLGEIKDLVTKKYKLRWLDDGTTRDVYELDDKRVLKVVKYNISRESNLLEARAYQCLGKQYAAEVLDYHPEGYWLVMERVDLLGSRQDFISKLEELTKFPFTRKGLINRYRNIETDLPKGTDVYYLSDLLSPGIHESDDGYHMIRYLLCKTSLWFKELNNRLFRCKVYAGDLGTSNFGLRKETGELVLLDYGFEMKQGDQKTC